MHGDKHPNLHRYKEYATFTVFTCTWHHARETTLNITKTFGIGHYKTRFSVFSIQRYCAVRELRLVTDGHMERGICTTLSQCHAVKNASRDPDHALFGESLAIAWLNMYQT